ncbi:Acid stress protein IbaG [Buchnera aphidicola (Cinara kochiana kochiana)]|uniref:Acid stress protein IbaG n=1 Tax=Buchnera aphidicola (Cinara kochiana kochiana) TaxID=2518976 RepID=A0A451D5R4_9GAMM|nr:BolA/IbaG family iron-sulfur metabolism protein [Buchnera aphidicola]VFP81156.1 Acid stress protein IbaG [Buchnera aphidicola (Cinara kochiana kochiana)]
MDSDKICTIIKKKLKLKKIFISKYNNNISITAIGDFFIGMNSLEKQKHIYTILMPYFIKKKIHAITINTYTISEWKKTHIKE